MADSDKFFFEGVEKVLEMDFVPGSGGDEAAAARGLRGLSRAQIDELCSAARCTVISVASNAFFDAYVLSESSLFVYPGKIILKTCGTTTLLVALEPLLKAAAGLGLSLEWVAYTRKNFQRPGQQIFPHRDHNEESAYLKQYFPEGNTFILGPVTSDHWVVFVSDYVDRPTDACCDRTLDMMMFGIDESVAKLFVKNDVRFPKHSDVTRASGIDTLLPGSLIDEFCFDPCGYSMNGLLYDAYWTIHITPESTFSYASFETNIRMKSYSGLIKAVLAIFKPKRWTMTLFADLNGAKALKETPFQQVVRVPVVASTSRAIMGPCVFSRDAHGNSIVSFEDATGVSPGGGVNTPLPLKDTGSGAVPAGPAASAAAAVPPSADELQAALLRGVEAVGEATSARGGLQVVTSDSGLLAPLTIAPQPAPTPRPLGGLASSSVAYVMTTKSQTEFVGDYSAYFGIYSLMGTVAGGGKAASAGVIKAASGTTAGATEEAAVPPPRAKYVVARRIEELKNKGRTESF